jgi:hypothetical protein
LQLGRQFNFAEDIDSAARNGGFETAAVAVACRGVSYRNKRVAVARLVQNRKLDISHVARRRIFTHSPPDHSERVFVVRGLVRAGKVECLGKGSSLRDRTHARYCQSGAVVIDFEHQARHPRISGN